MQMNSKRRRFTSGLAAVSLGASLVGLAAPAFAAAPNVATGGAIAVDGAFADWTGADLFAQMHRAGKADKPVESSLYLRYDCDAAVLYVAVIAADGVTVIDSDGDNFLKFGLNDKRVDGTDAPPDGTQPEFAYADAGAGWEASIALQPGDYSDLNVHAQVWDDDAAQTSAVIDRAIAMSISCESHSQSASQSASASASQSASQSASASASQSASQSASASASQSASQSPSPSFSPEHSTSGTSTTFPTPSESSEQSVEGNTGTPEQSVQGGTGTPAASMGNGSIAGIGTGHGSSGTAAWGLLLIVSAAGLWIGRRRAAEDAS
jgi:hypothetical protein